MRAIRVGKRTVHDRVCIADRRLIPIDKGGRKVDETVCVYVLTCVRVAIREERIILA